MTSNNLKMNLKTVLILTIFVCDAKSLINSLPPQAPYFLDEKLEQSVVYRWMDSLETEFQFEMADLLGIPEKPRRIKKPLSLKKAGSQFLLELYNSMKEEEEPHLSAYHNRVARSTLITKEDRTESIKCNNIVTFASKKRNSRNIKQAPEMTITFNTNHVPPDFQLLRAELRIFQNSILGRQFECEKNVTVSVSHRVLNHQLQKIELKLLSSLTTTTNFKGWLETNVTNILSKWLKRGYHPTGHDLIISTKLTGVSNEALVTPEDIGLIDVSGTEDFQPFIIAYFNGSEIVKKIRHLRFKRDLHKVKRYSTAYHGSQTEGGENYKLPKTCERMNFSIDFKDLQMQDWVIAPKKFEAYFCGGECNFPLGSRMNATNHAIVQTLMHLKQPNLPKPCCVPTVLGAISILHYINDDSVNLSKYPNSVAKSCGCH